MAKNLKLIVVAACVSFLEASSTASAGVCPPSDRLVMLRQGPACVAGSQAQAMGRNHGPQRVGCQAPNRVVRLPRGLYCLTPPQIAMLQQRLAELRQQQQQQQQEQQQQQQQSSGGGIQVFMPSSGQEHAGGGMQVFMPSKMQVFEPSPMKVVPPPSGVPSNASDYAKKVGNEIDPNHKGLNAQQIYWMNQESHLLNNEALTGSGMQWEYH